MENRKLERRPKCESMRDCNVGKMGLRQKCSRKLHTNCIYLEI